MPRFIVVGMPQTRRRHKHRMRLPIEPLPVLDSATIFGICIEALAHQRVATRLGVHHQIDCHRLVPVRCLIGSHRQQSKHRPDDVRDCFCLRENPVSQEHADPVGCGTVRIVADRFECVLHRFALVEGRGKLLPRGFHAQIPQQRLIVHKVNRGILNRQVRGTALRRQRKQVACLPRNLLAAGWAGIVFSG